MDVRSDDGDDVDFVTKPRLARAGSMHTREPYIDNWEAEESC